jgi:hypothetical protein
MTSWPRSPVELPPLEDTIHVWAVRLDDATVDLDYGHDLLSPEERERAARFKFRAGSEALSSRSHRAARYSMPLCGHRSVALELR